MREGKQGGFGGKKSKFPRLGLPEQPVIDPCSSTLVLVQPEFYCGHQYPRMSMSLSKLREVVNLWRSKVPTVT